MLRWYVTIRNESERVFEEGPYDQAYLQGATVEVSTHELTRAGLYYAEVTFDVLGIEEDSDEYHLTAYSPISELSGGKTYYHINDKQFKLVISRSPANRKWLLLPCYMRTAMLFRKLLYLNLQNSGVGRTEVHVFK